MITKFNTYNLITEKSNLNNIFNNTFVKNFYEKFKNILSHKLKIEQFEDYTINYIYKLKEHTNFIILEDSECIQILLTLQNKYFLYVCNKDNYIISLYRSYREFEDFKEILKNESIENDYIDYIHKYFITSINKYKNSNTTSDNTIADLIDKFNNKYTIYFQKIYHNMISKYKKLSFNILAKYNIFSEIQFEKLKYKLSSNDLENYYRYKSDMIILSRLIDKTYDDIKLKNFIIDIDNDITKLDIYNYNYNKKISQENIDKIIKELFFKVYTENNNLLHHKSQEYADYLINKDFKNYKKEKNKLFDKEMIDKWKHLDNANNFDLI